MGHKEIVYNVNSSTYGKRCLFLYITEPFCTKELSDKHQNQWQAKEIARIIGSRGFVVDVADYQFSSPVFKGSSEARTQVGGLVTAAVGHAALTDEILDGLFNTAYESTILKM